MDTYFAVAAPGLEGLVARELRELGLMPEERRAAEVSSSMDGAESGGVTFHGDLESLYRANLTLRTAARVLVRVGDFYAAAFSELRKKAGRLEWERYLAPGQPVNIHATCRKSRLYHSDAVAERVAGAISDHLGQPATLLKESEESGSASQLIVVRLLHDHCTISIDSSGELLHRRGYRQATAKAPLRETLAAGMILASGWDTGAPLLDPFCGSGTIPIEAAMLALGLPPGRNRRFAFMNWPGYDPQNWERLLVEFHVGANVELPIIQGSDRDAGAVQLAQANAGRAGVAEWIQFSKRAVSAVDPPPGPGWVITNPPYGLRVSSGKDLRNLYAQLGNVLRDRCRGWQVSILCSDFRLLGQTGLKLDTSLAFVNGGVPVKLGRGRVP